MAQTYQDPVCGMQVTVDTAVGKSEYNGNTYYFCFDEYKRAFDRNPEKYLKQTDERPN